MALTIDSLPAVGFGLWKVAPDNCAEVVYAAVEAGYRHFDGACDYGNEAQVGEGLRRAMDDGLCSRDELWITSKLWNTYHHPDHVPLALERSLRDLGLAYLDLYLVHFPIALAFVPFEDRYPPEWVYDPDADRPTMELAPVPLQDTWRAMEALHDAGLVRHIGVCNYSTALLHDLMSYARTAPAMLQVEMHPLLAQPRLLRLAEQYGIAVTAFSPLGAQSYVELGMAEPEEGLLDAPPVLAAAARLGRTSAQMLLRWAVQRGTAVVVKSTDPGRMRENLDVHGFELADDEMAALDRMDRGRRFNDPGAFCEAAFGTFHPIYD